MSSLAASGLPPEQIAAIRAALSRDPELELELEAIAAALEPVAARRLWAELADRLSRCERPAAAVLAALERATLG
jgi:hypothetical protein